MPVRIRSKMDWMRRFPSRRGMRSQQPLRIIAQQGRPRRAGRALVLTAERHADDARNRTTAPTTTASRTHQERRSHPAPLRRHRWTLTVFCLPADLVVYKVGGPHAFKGTLYVTADVMRST
jgi:hypothetical protein